MLEPGVYERPGLIVIVRPGGGWIPIATNRPDRDEGAEENIG